MRRLNCLALLAIALSPTSCAVSSGPGANGNATQLEIEDCRDACNKLKFFDCNDAVDHATCFQNCDTATSSQIDVFTACVDADICDAECSTHIQPATPHTPVPASQCTSLCESYLAEDCRPGTPTESCALVCAEEPALATYCLEGRSGCTLPAGCEIEQTTPQSQCRDSCQFLGLFDCITPTDAADCSARCDTADTSTISSFNTCTSTGLCEDDSCYRILNPAGGSADVSGCRMACDHIALFDCIDAATQSECRNLCAEASAQTVDNFKACTQGACEDDSCWVVFMTDAAP